MRFSRRPPSLAVIARAELRSRPGRAMTIGAGVLAASVCFGLLSSETTTSEAHVASTVKRNFRAAYDILVRPKGAETTFERKHRVVDDGFLSALFGGITMRQYDEIKSLPGVSLAAPVADVGYFLYQQTLLVPFPDTISRSKAAAFKVDLNWNVHNGLSKYPGATLYLYWSPRAINFVPSGNKYQPSPVGEEDFAKKAPLPVCRGWMESFPYARAASGSGEAAVGASVTATVGGGASSPNPYAESTLPSFDCAAELVTLDGKSVATNEPNRIDGEPSGKLGAEVTFALPVLVAGIDPNAEERLVGLKGAITSGTYLSEGAGLSEPGNVPNTGKPLSQCARFSLSQPSTCDVRTYPVIASTSTYLDEAADLTVHRLNVPAGTDLAAEVASYRNAYAFLTHLSGPVVAKLAVSPTTAWRAALSNFTSNLGFDSADGSGFSLTYWRPSATSDHVSASGLITPSTVPNDPSVWVDNSRTKDVVGLSLAPPGSDDTWYRSLTAYGASFAAVTIDGKRTAVTPLPKLVGTFAPAKLRGFSPLSKVPLQTFYPPTVTAGSAAARKVLGTSPLGPTTDVAGYLSQPPLLLTTVQGAIALDNGEGDAGMVRPGLRAVAYQGASPRAPVSTIQVRVKGVSGPNRSSLRRIDAVASQIEQRTGLTVDITAGSSPTTERVALAPGKFGQPALVVDQGWVKKGVAVAIIRALQAKDIALFLLVLVVSGLFVGSATAAAARGRRGEIATLSALGWQARSIFMLVVGEAALVGFVAGIVGCALALVLTVAGSLDIPALRLGLIVPAAVALAALAAVIPAARTATVAPVVAVHDPVRPGRRAHPVHSVEQLAMANLAQVPGRSAVALVTVLVGVGGLSFIVGTDLAFRDKVAGNLLGGFVSMSVRGVDLVSAGIVAMLGVAALMDVLHTNLRERRSELAVLRATGWTERAVRRLALDEGLMLASVGSLFGAGIGLGVATAAGSPVVAALIGAAIAGVAGCVVAVAGTGLLVAVMGAASLPTT